MLAVALGENTYVWRADSGEVTHLGEVQGEEQYVSSVDFSNDGQFLGVGVSNGDVELWDLETQTKLRTMGGHASQVACLSWNTHILSSGSGDGSIWHHDVRVSKHKVGELLGHQGEVCGLKWRSDGDLLASGGNDNVVNVWDGRVGDVASGSRGTARWTKRNHTAAVKVSKKKCELKDGTDEWCQLGDCLVSVAAFAACVWRRHIGRNGPYLEHDDRGATALVGDTVAGDIDTVVATPEGIPDNAWVPNECVDDSQLSVYGESC